MNFHLWIKLAVFFGYISFVLSLTKSQKAILWGRIIVAFFAFIAAGSIGFGIHFLIGMRAFSAPYTPSFKETFWLFSMGLLIIYFLATGLSILLVRLTEKIEKIMFAIHFVAMFLILSVLSAYDMMLSSGILGFCYMMLWFRLYQKHKELNLNRG